MKLILLALVLLSVIILNAKKANYKRDYCHNKKYISTFQEEIKSLTFTVAQTSLCFPCFSEAFIFYTTAFCSFISMLLRICILTNLKSVCMGNVHIFLIASFLVILSQLRDWVLLLLHVCGWDNTTFWASHPH